MESPFQAETPDANLFALAAVKEAVRALMGCPWLVEGSLCDGVEVYAKRFHMAPALIVDIPTGGRVVAIPLAVGPSKRRPLNRDAFAVQPEASDVEGAFFRLPMDQANDAWVWVVDIGDARAEFTANRMLSDARNVASEVLAMTSTIEWLAGTAPAELRDVLEQNLSTGSHLVALSDLAPALLLSTGQQQLWPAAPEVRPSEPARLGRGVYRAIRDASTAVDPVQRMRELVAEQLAKHAPTGSRSQPRSEVRWDVLEDVSFATEIPRTESSERDPRFVAAAGEIAAHIQRDQPPDIFVIVKEPADVRSLLREVAGALSAGRYASRRLVEVKGSDLRSSAELRSLLEPLARDVLVATDDTGASGSFPSRAVGEICLSECIPWFTVVRPLDWPHVPTAESRPTVAINLAHASNDPWVWRSSAIADEFRAMHETTFTEEAIADAARSVPKVIEEDDSHPITQIRQEHGQVRARMELVRARLDLAAARASNREDRIVRVTDMDDDPWSPRTVREASPSRDTATGIREKLASEILGQDAALETISNRIWIGSSGLRANRERPEAVLMLAGPSGSGKTATAKAIARARFGDPNRLIRIDLGNFHSRHTSAALLGSPPGYVGHTEREQWLTTKMRDMRSGVLVLDEIEKADPQLRMVLLEVLDTGRLTDFAGTTVMATDFVIAITTNIGSGAYVANALGFGAEQAEPTLLESRVTSDLTCEFAPEFLNRIDDVIVFPPLPPTALFELCRRYVSELIAVARPQGYELNVPDSVVDHLVETCDTTRYGARPLQRAVDEYLGATLSELPTGRWSAELIERHVEWRCTISDVRARTTTM